MVLIKDQGPNLQVVRVVNVKINVHIDQDILLGASGPRQDQSGLWCPYPGSILDKAQTIPHVHQLVQVVVGPVSVGVKQQMAQRVGNARAGGKKVEIYAVIIGDRWEVRVVEAHGHYRADVGGAPNCAVAKAQHPKIVMLLGEARGVEEKGEIDG